MNSSSLKTTCNVLSVVDFLLIGGMFFYFQKKISNLEKGGFTSTADSTASTPATPFTSSENKTKESSSKIIEKRVLRLEKDNEVLLQRMQFYDELFSKILSHIKENKDHGASSHVHHQSLDPSQASLASPVRKTYLQHRSSDSLLKRKEPFIDESEVGESEAGEYKSDVIPNKIKEVDEDGEDGEDDYEEDMFSYLKN